MSYYVANFLLILTLIVFVVIFIIVYIYTQNKFVSKYGELNELEVKIMNTKRLLSTTKKEIEKEIETFKKEETIKVREEMLAKKQAVEEEIKALRVEHQFREDRIVKKEENLDNKIEKYEARLHTLEDREKKLIEKENIVDEIKQKQEDELLKISNLTRDEAKQIILDKLDDDLIKEKAQLIKTYEDRLQMDKEKMAKNILSTAINKASSEYVVNSTITVVELPNDDMKGRIIGKEGRNIRAIEAATGVDLIIDDTPETVLLSSFDGVRREIARLSLEQLIEDGRIHPGKIEEIVDKATDKVNHEILVAAESAMLEVGVHTLPKEVQKTLGKLKYRSSYGQNVLQHSIEVAHAAGVLANELGLDVNLAKKAGLLHDIGKAFTHEMEGSHALIGAEYIKKYINDEKLVNAIEAHHDEVSKKTIEAVIVQAADAISASRPGARRETLSNYIKRLEQLEEIANSYEGIENSYAIQAGRELRLIVSPDKISDEEALVLSHKVSKDIESKMTYPGQIKVTVVRETRAVEYAK